MSAGVSPAQVDCAINRATKEKRVAELEEALRNSSVAFGVRFNKVSVRALAPLSSPLMHTLHGKVGFITWPCSTAA